jgi:hypothetical protein
VRARWWSAPGSSARVIARRRTWHRGRKRQRNCPRHADVAQLVAHHLAKVRVAGSNPVVRSSDAQSGRWDQYYSDPAAATSGGVAEWLRQGPAKPCTRVRFPPPPRGAAHQVHALTRGDTTQQHHPAVAGAISSVGEHYLDTVGVTGSIPVSPTLRHVDFAGTDGGSAPRVPDMCQMAARGLSTERSATITEPTYTISLARGTY